MSPLGTFLRGSAPKPNAAPALRITLARRLVETPGAPFVLSEEVFTEVASARDELGLLPAAQGPTIVRVQVEGGTASEQESLAGDWLVDPDGGDVVARLPAPRWNYNVEAKAWASARPWLEAWETCSDARWMLQAASLAGIARPLLVLAACTCARTALRFLPSGEERPLRAIEAAERWVRGEATLEEVRDVGDDAWTVRSANIAVCDAARAAGNAALTVAADYFNGVAATDASSAADAAAAAAYYAYAAACCACASSAADSAAAKARYADLVRREIPTLVVLRTVAVRASTP